MTQFASGCSCALAIAVAWLWIAADVRAQDKTAPTKEQGAVAQEAADPAGVEFFEKKVRPLLVARCHECHGATKQKGNLRLDSLAAILKGGDTSPAIVPGKPEESLLVDAIRYGDVFQMPPKSQLPAEDVATLIEWVRIGAPWRSETTIAATGSQAPAPFDLAARAGHWSFQPIAAVEPPNVDNPGWVKTPVDRFILARLEAAGLKPAPAADKRTLLRRVTYDLVGLPPTPADIEAFLADESPTAWEKVVDRLLASPHYGERWARHWLDLVRYAETWGHEFDYDMPNAFRYRDYVIRALNDDLPYDRFVVEHVAGDLLPTPRRHPHEGFNESVIATGCFFLGESKHSPVDVRQDEADRIDNQIDVFGKTFLGLTIACARCHDHKFDPISTKDYYALAGYLESSRYQQAFIDPPEALENTISQLKQLQGDRRRRYFDFAREALQPRLRQLAQTLLARLDAPSAEEWDMHFRETALAQVDSPFHPWAALTQKNPDASVDSFAERRAKLAAQLKEQLAGRPASESVVFADFGSSGYGSWRTCGEAFGNGPGKPLEWAHAGPRGRFPGRVLDNNAAHSGLVSTKLRGTLRSPTFTIEQPKIFYRLYGTGGQVRLILDGLLLITNPIYGGLQFDAGGEQPHWREQDVSKWIGERAYIEVNDDGDGYLALEKVVFADGAAPGPKPNCLVAKILDDPVVTSPAALADKYQALFQQVLGDWLAEPSQPRLDAADRGAIIRSILEQRLFDPQPSKSQEQTFQASLAALDERQRQIEVSISPPRQAMALADGTPENERVFVRGSHKTLGDEVPRRFLEVLGGTRQAPPEQSSGRLELAQQMISDEQGLLRRVIVNRLWQHHFGEGIVRSPDDFGVMGQAPTHPELLDYLAADLVHQRWSLKQMHRLMVLSNAYQMSSQSGPESELADPQNKRLHRMPMRRLEAECIRDAILTVSGQADAKLYGPSVLPNFTPYMTGRGRPKDSGPLDGQGRRSIYLGVRRNFLSPMFLAFDYPIPFTTMGRRSMSNVPAQALTMMNNPFVIEQARLWAARVVSMPDRSDHERVLDMYVTALGRPPEDAEELAALDFLGRERGSSALNDPRAWADLAHVLFNVKEFIFVQ
jgi:hypothetical protein